MIDGLPPDDSTPETRRWERWAERVRVYDMVRAAGRPGVCTAITDDSMFVRLDGRTDPEPFEWCDVDVYP
jgi:hypothetical protein